ncbi:MAG: hypothetical protein R2875_08035 [Desulfobacterales bacterium]
MLEAKTGDARMISQSLGFPKDVYAHIFHIRKPLRPWANPRGDAARCISCGYEFETREKSPNPGGAPDGKKNALIRRHFRLSEQPGVYPILSIVTRL